MSLKINTNIAALNAHRNMLKNDTGLSRSLERLSSGLRINRAADDAAGMSIADNLRAQALGLGQAIKNGNDGVAFVQIADGALDESINLVNMIRTKAIQAASDSQSTNSRSAIQADINKLLEEMQMIANTTAFNGVTLLDGTFSDKKLQVGAYSGETISISIGNAQTSRVGAYATQDGSGLSEEDVTAASNFAADITINGAAVAVTGSATDAKVVADAINGTASVGVTAEASNVQTGSGAIAADSTVASTDELSINGVSIGVVSWEANDSTGSLTSAINAISAQTGVTASVDSGALVLTSTDGSNIRLTTAASSSVDDNIAFALGTATYTDQVLKGTVTLESEDTFTVTAGGGVGTTATTWGFTAGTQNLANSISSVNVGSQTGADTAIKIADYAIKYLDSVRSDLGSAQNQLEATVRNITVTQVNITAAESSIRDVDFAAESANFAKFQVLAQSGSFAMAQANASLQNVLRLLQ